MSDEGEAAWLDVCHWIAANTQKDALVLTPPDESWAFKWYARRAEFVSSKDCPQDATGIIEWNRRLNFLKRWAQETHDGGYSDKDLRQLHDETGVTHLLVRRLGPFESDPVYRNQTYRVFAVRL